MNTYKKMERIGLERVSRDGKRAKVIEYNTCQNFLVEFEDGTVRRMTKWNDFQKGQFNYAYMFHKVRTSDRIGTKLRMNNGLVATVVEYVNSHNMAVQFEDGAIAYDVSWRDFEKGNVSHPILKGTQISFNELVIAFYLEPLGFEKVSQRSTLSKKIGMNGKEIDLYNQKTKIAVEYDGEYAHADVEKDTEKNILLADLGIKVYRFREPKCPVIDGNNYILADTKNLSKSLESCLRDFVGNVLNYDSSKIDFEKDEAEIKQFVRMRKRNSLHLFEENVMSNGMKCTIVEMTSCRDITVMFEDGVIVRDRDYGSFKKGNIAHPDETSEAKKNKRLFQKRIMNNGHEATVIEYDGWDKLVIEFDNGEKVYNRNWWSFENGKIGLPSSYVKNCIGERKLQKRGMFAEIISCVDANHIDVRFDDGTIIKNRKYSDFINGIIGNPNLLPARNRKDTERIGEVRVMNDGSTGTIVAYRNAGDIDIDFGDGRIARHKKYAHFSAGRVKCPI